MEPLPPCIRLWTSMVNGPRFTCSNCGPTGEDHGPERLARFHLRTPNHLKKVRQMDALHCKVCNLQFLFKSKYDRHINSTPHKQKEHPLPPTEYKCETCSIKCISKKDYDRHLETRKHAKKVNPQTQSQYYCKVCELDCKFKARHAKHLATAKHRKNVSKTDSSGAPLPNPVS